VVVVVIPALAFGQRRYPGGVVVGVGAAPGSGVGEGPGSGARTGTVTTLPGIGVGARPGSGAREGTRARSGVLVGSK